MDGSFRPAIALLALATALACDPGGLGEPPPRTCSETGALCDLGGGPLGVCERRPCRAGEAEPCFHCAPQH